MYVVRAATVAQNLKRIGRSDSVRRLLQRCCAGRHRARVGAFGLNGRRGRRYPDLATHAACVALGANCCHSQRRSSEMRPCIILHSICTVAKPDRTKSGTKLQANRLFTGKTSRKWTQATTKGHKTGHWLNVSF